MHTVSWETRPLFFRVFMVPTLCVGIQAGTLQRPKPQSGSGCIPT